jgi:hypothetical protein
MKTRPPPLARAARWSLPFVLLALPFVVAQEQGQSDDEPQEHEQQGLDDVEDRIVPLPRSPAPVALPAASFVSDAQRERGSPFLVGLPDGRAWLGALEWEAGAGDRVVVRELDPVGVASRTLVVDATPAEIERPVGVLDAQGRLDVFWTALVDDVPQLRFARLEGEAFTPPRTLTTGARNANVEATLHRDGQVWLAWESFAASGADGRGRGSIDVLLAPLTTATKEGATVDALGPSVRVGPGPASDLDPVVASAGDSLVVAWSRYGGRDYDVVLRRFDPKKGGESGLGPIVDVSGDAASDDLHPSLVATKSGELWVAWDRLDDPTRGSSIPPTLRGGDEPDRTVFVMAARVRGDVVELAAGANGWPAGAVPIAPRLCWNGGTPRLALDAKERPWIASRVLESKAGTRRSRRFGYATVVQRLESSGWTRPVEVEASDGFAEECPLAAAGDGVWCAGQQDHRDHAGSMFNANSAPKQLRKHLADLQVDVGTWLGPTGIFVARVDESAGAKPDAPVEPASAPVAFVAREERRSRDHFHPEGDLLDDPIVSGAEHLVVARMRPDEKGASVEQKWNVYWGDLHRHSSISRCSRGFEPMPPQRYEFGRDVWLYDFMAMTDHAGQIDPFSWWQLDKLCWYERTPTFCPLAGYECSAASWGHQNVILDGRITPLVALASNLSRIDKSVNPFKLLYSRLSPDHAIAIPHATADGGRHVRFDECDPKLVKLVEVYQALRGNYEFEGCARQSQLASVFGSFAQDGLRQGLRYGFVASTDHGNGASYAGVLAEKLDRASLFDALKTRRTFGATTKGLFVDLRVGDAAREAVMGEELVASGPLKVHVKARGARELAEVVLFRSGAPWRVVGRGERKPDDLVSLTIELTPNIPAALAQRNSWSFQMNVKGAQWSSWPAGRPLPRGDEGHGFSADGGTARFVWPQGFTGFRPNDFRIRLRAPRSAAFKTSMVAGASEYTVADLLAEPLEGRASKANFKLVATERFDDAQELAHGLGVKSVEQEWTDDDPPAENGWYYARVTQTDGEMAWSSPIFVSAH